jgi:hypothetical protein
MKKKGLSAPGAERPFLVELKLTDRRDVHGCGAFFALRDVKGNSVAVFQGFETAAVDPGVVDENVLTVFRLDEAVTFFVVEPLHSSVGHLCTLLS